MIDTTGAYLLVQAGDGFMGFAAFRTAEKKLLAWVVYKTEPGISLQDQLGAMAAKHTWVHTNYKKVLLVQYAAVNALVPAALNSDNGKELLLEQVIGPQQNSLLLRDIVLQQNLVNNYTVEVELADALNKRFPKADWWHVQSLLLARQAVGGTCVTATIYFNEVQLTVERNGNWLLLQTYHYQTPEDVLYYLLNAMQQLDLSQEETTVYLQGMIDQHSALYDVLYSYILNLQLKDELTYSFPTATDEHPVHLSASLDQVLACVS